MPFPNFHAARVKSPGLFVSKSFKTKSIAPGVTIITGKLKSDPEGSMVAQTYRFKKTKYSATEARAWLRENKIKPMSFEPAEGDYAMTAEELGQHTTESHLQTNQTRGPGQQQGDPLYGVNLAKEAKAKDKKDPEDAKGNGSVAMGNEAYQTAKDEECEKCGGTGNCPNCEGEGVCPTCKGTGKVKEDEGKKPDAKSNTCPECKGSGECSMCEGSGKCPACGGEGELSSENPPEDKRSPSQKANDLKKEMGGKEVDNLDQRLIFRHWDAMGNTPEWMVKPFERTVEGFLRGRAVVTNVGVFEYKKPDGSIQRELRLPEEVFSRESLESLKLKPMTNDHPKVMVTPDNVKDLQIGTTGDNPASDPGPYGPPNYGSLTGQPPMSDRYRLAIDLCVTEKDAIQIVMDGKRNLSCGYDCELETAAVGARWMGMPYDFIQRNIRYNHVAIVDAARAGDDAVIHLDSANSDALVQVSNIKEDAMNLKTVKLDGVEYQAEAEVIATLNRATEKVDSLDKQVKQLTSDSAKILAERDTALDKIKSLETENATLKKDQLDPTKIANAVKERVRIVDAATALGIEVKDDSPDNEAKKAVIMKVFPSASLDGKTEEYISARFDGALESIVKTVESGKNIFAHGDQLPAEEGKGKSLSLDSVEEGDAAAAQKRMIARQKTDSRLKE